VTINIYFPAAAVEKAAEKIVEETWGDADQSPEGEKPESRIPSPWRFSLKVVGAAPAAAQEADINVTTPAIRALKQSMRQRAEVLKPYMNKGDIGINNGGHLVVRQADKIKLKERAGVIKQVEKENSDREALYSEIAKANNFDPSRVGDIRKIFAKTWIDNARVGWWIQTPNGEWIKKQPQ
jgi:uncharacterized protein YdbL (DUF1318 family)